MGNHHRRRAGAPAQGAPIDTGRARLPKGTHRGRRAGAPRVAVAGPITAERVPAFASPAHAPARLERWGVIVVRRGRHLLRWRAWWPADGRLVQDRVCPFDGFRLLLSRIPVPGRWLWLGQGGPDRLAPRLVDVAQGAAPHEAARLRLAQRPAAVLVGMVASALGTKIAVDRQAAAGVLHGVVELAAPRRTGAARPGAGPVAHVDVLRQPAPGKPGLQVGQQLATEARTVGPGVGDLLEDPPPRPPPDLRIAP